MDYLDIINNTDLISVFQDAKLSHLKRRL